MIAEILGSVGISAEEFEDSIETCRMLVDSGDTPGIAANKEWLRYFRIGRVKRTDRMARRDFRIAIKETI